MKHTLTILAALFGMIMGLSMVLPQLGQWSRAGIMPSPPFLFVGTGLVIAGGIVTFRGLRRRRAVRGKKWIDVCIVAAGIFYAMPFIFAFFQTRATNLAGWIFCAGLSMASVAFFGACLYFNRRLSVPSIDEGRCRN